MKIFLVIAEHPTIPGVQCIPCISRDAANRKAAELATIIRSDCGISDVPTATPETWQRTMKAIAQYYGKDAGATTYIEIQKTKIFV